MFPISVAKRMYHRFERINQRRNEIQLHGSVLDSYRALTADRLKQGFSFWDSFCYELKYNDYRDYISSWEAWQPVRSKSAYFKISADKYLFACVFGPHITVPPTYALIEKGQIVDVNVRNKDIYDRIWEAGGAFIKDRFGCEGFNVVELRANNDGLYHKDRLLTEEDLQDIIRGFSKGIIQGRLTQGKFENDIFGGSINTIRIISMRKRNSIEHEVVGAVHRFGTKKSAPVDNFHQGGFSAPIDIETGRMGRLAAIYDTDADGKHNFHAKHPDTGAQVEGIVVPDWERLKDLVAELHKNCLSLNTRPGTFPHRITVSHWSR